MSETPKISESQKALFEKYKLSKEQIELFFKLRKDVSEKDLTDVRLIMCICSKKTYEKASKSAKAFSKMLKDYKVDTMKKSDFPKLYKEHKYFKTVISSEFFYTLPTPTKEGYGVAIMDYSKWVPTKKQDERELTMKAFLVMFEQFVLSNPSFVSEGVIFVCTLREFSLWQFDFAIEKMAANMMNVFPVRMKNMIVVDTPWYFRMIWNLLKPFYSAKMKKRMTILKGTGELPKYLKKSDYPKEVFGGEVEFSYKKYLKEEFDIDYVQDKKEVEKEKEEMGEKEILEKFDKIKKEAEELK